MTSSKEIPQEYRDAYDERVKLLSQQIDMKSVLMDYAITIRDLKIDLAREQQRVNLLIDERNEAQFKLNRLKREIASFREERNKLRDQVQEMKLRIKELTKNVAHA